MTHNHLRTLNQTSVVVYHFPINLCLCDQCLIRIQSAVSASMPVSGKKSHANQPVPSRGKHNFRVRGNKKKVTSAIYFLIELVLPNPPCYFNLSCSFCVIMLTERQKIITNYFFQSHPCPNTTITSSMSLP